MAVYFQGRHEETLVLRRLTFELTGILRKAVGGRE